MTNKHTEKKEDDWWIGWIEEVPGMNCQETSLQELKETLKITLKEALAFNRLDAIAAAAGKNYRDMDVKV